LELLLRKKPIFTDGSGSIQNLSSYFLLELKSRPVEEIVASQIREEATKEEIKSVASLAESCLKLRGEDRPTMKEVEIALHALQTKRPKFCVAAPNMQLLSHSRVQGITGQLLATTTHVDQPTHECYSLEQEFLASSGLA